MREFVNYATTSINANATLLEFKEIRKEWKAKKKEEEAARKADDERLRQGEGRSAEQHEQSGPVYGNLRTPLGPPPSMGGPGGPQLPPIGYAPPSGGQSQPQYQAQGVEGMAQYATNTNQIYSNGNNTGHSYPQSPYQQPQGQVYQQRCQPSPHSSGSSS